MNMVNGGKLKRHIKRNHKHEEEVKDILTKPQALQNIFFDQKRKEGIYSYNIKQLEANKEDGTSFMRERRPKEKDSLRMCAGCKRFFSNRSFYKHRLHCHHINTDAINPQLLIANDRIHKDAEFSEEILHKFRVGIVGDICRSDKIIQQIGYRHFNMRRFEKSKRDEVRKNVMGEMRDLSRLYVEYKSLEMAAGKQDVSVESMFTRDGLTSLREAMNNLCKKESDQNQEKHGLKMNLNAIIHRSIKSLMGYFAESRQDGKYKELTKFEVAYNFLSHELLSRARYQCFMNSVDKARRPEQLPLENEVQQLMLFIKNEISRILNNFVLEEYGYLQKLCVARLTLFNARRGEEPARLLLTEWQDAIKNVWLPQALVEKVEDPAERFLLGQFRLAYLHGKGKKFVPVLLPEDLVPATQLIQQHRHAAGIKDTNIFFFAPKRSNRHRCGWESVQKICTKSKISLNATKNRHRIATIYAGLHMTPEDKIVFMKHMGHKEQIDEDDYQCPIGIKEVRVMGKLLNTWVRGGIH